MADPFYVSKPPTAPNQELIAYPPLMPLTLQFMQGRRTFSVGAPKRDAGYTFADIHYWLELGVVLDGSVERRIGAWRQTLCRGDVWLVGMWDSHSCLVKRNGTRYVIAETLPQSVAKLSMPGQEQINWLAPFLAAPHDRPIVPRNRREEMARLGEKLAELSDTEIPLQHARIPLRLADILLFLMEKWTTPATVSPSASAKYTLIDKAMEMALTRRNRIPAAEAADACGVSVDTLDRHFREATGVPFGQFSLRRRVFGAGQQLQFSVDSIKTIAREWGFANSGHLDHLIRSHYGCNPTVLRKNHQDWLASQKAASEKSRRPTRGRTTRTKRP